MSLWDFVNDLTEHKKGLYSDATKKDYVPFMINRALSMHPDTILYADEMNYYRDLDTRLQHDYYFHSVRPRKRFGGKWPKKTSDEMIDIMTVMFGFSYEKARDALKVLTSEQLEELKKKTETGGVIGS